MKITKRQLRRIIKEEKEKLLKELTGQYGLQQDDDEGNEMAIQIALDHFQMLDNALANAGIELAMGQIQGIIAAALERY